MPRQKEQKQDKQKTWLEEYYERPGYGPPGGTVANLTDQEMIDHVEMLVEHLSNDDPKKRIKAAEAMSAYIADDAFLPEHMEVHPAQVLATLFFRSVPDRLACISASRCLGIMGRRAAPYASAALTRVLSNSGSDLRYEALVALGYLGPEAAPEAATAVAERATTDEDSRLRRQALLTLTMFGPDAAQAAGAAIAKACQDEDTDVQVSAMKCMKVMGPEMDGDIAGPALKKVLASGSAEMRRFAMETIAVIGHGVAQHCSKAVAHHLRPLPGSDPTLRHLAVLALESMGPQIVYEQEVLLSRAIRDPEREVGEQAFLTLRDAGCVKGMMGSMFLEERIFSPEVLAASKFVTENSDSNSNSSSESSSEEDVDDFGSSVSEEQQEEESEDDQAAQDKEDEERREEERVRRMVICPEDAPMSHTTRLDELPTNDAGPVSPTCGNCDGAIEAKPSQGWVKWRNGLPVS